MKIKHQKFIVDMTLTVIVAGTVLSHDQMHPAVIQLFPDYSINDHLPEKPAYQDSTRTSFSVTSITSGSTTTTTTAP